MGEERRGGGGEEAGEEGRVVRVGERSISLEWSWAFLCFKDLHARRQPAVNLDSSFH